MRLPRVASGIYTNGTARVERTASGWRWSACADPSTGGEWRATKREALLDLEEYCSPAAIKARSEARAAAANR